MHRKGPARHRSAAPPFSRDLVQGGQMSQIEIRPISEEDVGGFHACIDAVARERKYLAFVQAPPLENTPD
jgi:hypothetical protein